MRVLKKGGIALSLLLLFILIGYFFFGYKGDAPKITQKKLADNKVLVLAGLVDQEIINDKLNAIGTGRARSTVSLTPLGSGILEKIYVRSGAKVKKNTLIAQLDNSKQVIDVEKAQLQFRDAQSTVERLEKLRESNTASAVQLMDARLILQNAKLALEEAKIALDQRSIKTPIDGIVGILPINVGNYVTPNTPIGRVDDLSKILVDIWIAEQFVPFIYIGEPIKASLIAAPNKEFFGKVTAIDNMVDVKSRTLHIRAELDNKNDNLRSGMSFETMLKFSGDSYLSVNPLAIQWSSSGAYIWKIVENAAKKIPISIVQRNSYSVLIKGNLAKNDYIVLEGAQNLHEGSPLEIKNKKDLDALKKQIEKDSTKT